MKCKGSDGCKLKATHDFHGTKTCLNCLMEHIEIYLASEAIEEYIEMNATKLNQENV